MKRLIVTHPDGSVSTVEYIDRTRVADGVLYAMRSPYSGGVLETVKAFPLVNVKMWEVES